MRADFSWKSGAAASPFKSVFGGTQFTFGENGEREREAERTPCVQIKALRAA